MQCLGCAARAVIILSGVDDSEVARAQVQALGWRVLGVGIEQRGDRPFDVGVPVVVATCPYCTSIGRR